MAEPLECGSLGYCWRILSAPEALLEISRWWSEAKPPVLIKRVSASRQGRWNPAPLQGASHSRHVPGGFASLHHRLISAAPAGAVKFASSIPGQARLPHSKGSARR
jgi:hypothetical protein